MVTTMWARIENGTVVELTDIDPTGRYHPSLEWTPCGEEVRPGWVYDGAFAPPSPAEPTLTVPSSITMRQARLCLHRHGLLASVQPAIDALPEPDRTAAQIEWDYSAAVERNRGFVVMIGQSLGLTETQLDELFIEAAQL